MDPKVLCPTLSVMLVKTIKALCEINIKYDQKLEITGSLHVRSDGEKVLTCLLDETTIKGQQDASKAAEIAGRLALHNIGFPFPTLQLPGNASQPQQMAAFLSPIQAGVPPGMPPPPPPAHVLPNDRDKSITSPTSWPVCTTVQASSSSSSSHHDLSSHLSNPLSMEQQRASQKGPQENHRGGHGPISHGLPSHQPSLLPGHLHMVPLPPHSTHSSSSHHHSHSKTEPMDTEAVVQAELHEAMVSLRRQSSGSGSTSGSSESTTPKTAHSSSRPPAPSVAKLLEASVASCMPPVSSAAAMAATAAVAAAAAAQNHIRLPNIQTLTQCLPKYTVKMEVGERPGGTTHTVQTTGNSTPTQPKDEGQHRGLIHHGHANSGGEGSGAMTSNAMSTPTSTSPSSASSTLSMAMPFLVDPLASVKVEVQQQLDSDGNLVHKKKFQCTFCGIFLSTKCYLKNHINAMHTRARVYPCELCERYFYSAGALRIHKLRNHWQGSKKHKCAHCGETFLLPIELRKHILKKHLGSPEAMLMEGSNPAHLGFMMKGGEHMLGGPSHFSSAGVTMATTMAEAAMAAASLAAAGVGEPLSLVTSPVQVAPQNLSRTPVSSDSPASVTASLDDSHASLPQAPEGTAHSHGSSHRTGHHDGGHLGGPMEGGHHTHMMLATTPVQQHNELGNGRGGHGGRHDHTGIAPISPPNDAMHTE